MGGARGLESAPPTAATWSPRRRLALRPPRNLTPLLRLIGLIALAILVVVLLVVWVEGCTAEAKRDRNSTYLADIGAIGNASAQLGQQLGTLLTTPGLNAGGPRREARRLRPDGREPDAAARRTSTAPGPMVVPNDGRRRGAALPRERAPRPADRVQGDGRRDGRERRGRAAPRADAAPPRERHHLDGLVPGSRPRSSSRTRGSRASTSRRRSSSRPTTSSARARSRRSGSGSRARRPAARRPASTATRSRT